MNRFERQYVLGGLVAGLTPNDRFDSNGIIGYNKETDLSKLILLVWNIDVRGVGPLQILLFYCPEQRVGLYGLSKGWGNEAVWRQEVRGRTITDEVKYELFSNMFTLEAGELNEIINQVCMLGLGTERVEMRIDFSLIKRIFALFFDYDYYFIQVKGKEVRVNWGEAVSLMGDCGRASWSYKGRNQVATVSCFLEDISIYFPSVSGTIKDMIEMRFKHFSVANMRVTDQILMLYDEGERIDIENGYVPLGYKRGEGRERLGIMMDYLMGIYDIWKEYEGMGRRLEDLDNIKEITAAWLRCDRYLNAGLRLLKYSIYLALASDLKGQGVGIEIYGEGHNVSIEYYDEATGIALQHTQDWEKRKFINSIVLPLDYCIEGHPYYGKYVNRRQYLSEQGVKTIDDSVTDELVIF